MLINVLAFGFCEFADQESTLRALRLLNKLSLGGKRLVIRVADKSKPQFLRYIENSKRKKQGLAPLPEVTEVVVYKQTSNCLSCYFPQCIVTINDTNTKKILEVFRSKNRIQLCFVDFLEVLILHELGEFS